jgi:hypothetical protein
VWTENIGKAHRVAAAVEGIARAAPPYKATAH